MGSQLAVSVLIPMVRGVGTSDGSPGEGLADVRAGNCGTDSAASRSR